MPSYQDIRDAHEILAIVRPHVTLTKRGANWFGKCPFHEERTASFAVHEGRQRFKCFGCGAGGNVISFVSLLRAISYQDAAKLLESGMNGANTPVSQPIRMARAAANKPPEAFLPLDWAPYAEGYSRAAQQRLSKWRGYSLKFCEWLEGQRCIGVTEGCWAFPIFHENEIVRAHIRCLSGARWFYRPGGTGCPVTPLVIHGLRNRAHLFESQWDMLALMDRFQRDNNPSFEDAFIATRGSANAHKIGGLVRNCSCVYAYGQNDKAGAKWLLDVREILPASKVLLPPLPTKDLNDWLKSGGNLGKLMRR